MTIIITPMGDSMPEACHDLEGKAAWLIFRRAARRYNFGDTAIVVPSGVGHRFYINCIRDWTSIISYLFICLHPSVITLSNHVAAMILRSDSYR